MKYSQWIGILASITLVVACFLPWTYYPDLDKNFTGFFTEQNVYGKPGKVFVVFAVIAVILYITPRVWAKRWNMLFTGITVAYAIKSYLLFSGCYRGICPEKLTGIWIMLGASLIMLLMSVFPDLKLREK